MKVWMSKKKLLCLGVITVFFSVVFFCMLIVPASADTGSYTDLKSYESYLIKEGDTLSSIAASHAGRLSHVTAKEYVNEIMRLNNIESEYITAGEYLLLPDFID